MGPAAEASAAFGKGVSVMFPGNTAYVECLLTQLSREPLPPLPGGYCAGEKVFFTGDSHTHSEGYKWSHGQAGEVTGPSTGGLGDKGVDVLFPGNKGNVNCLITELSRRMHGVGHLPDLGTSP